MTCNRGRARRAKVGRIGRSRALGAWMANLSVALVTTAIPAVCFAEGPTAGQDAQAEDLFQRAKAAMARKDYKDACPMLAESYRLAGGGGTLQNLATCYEEEGKVAFAYNRFSELRTMSLKANRQDRVKLADEHIAKLKSRISRLRVRIPDANRVPQMKISVDGDDFGEPSWDAGIVVNTGTHVVRVSAPGKKPVELKKKVEDEGTLEVVEVPKLADEKLAPVVPPPSSGPTLDDLDRVSARRALRTTGFVVGGIGLATALAGGVFGVLTISTNNAAKSACRDNTGGTLSTKGIYDTGAEFDSTGQCFGQTPAWGRANELHGRASTFGTVSTVLVPVGLVGLALGGYFIYSTSSESMDEPKPKPSQRASAKLLPTLGGALLVGEFE